MTTCSRLVFAIATTVGFTLGAADISYSDGQSHDLAAESGGSHYGSITLGAASKLNLTGGDFLIDTSSVKANDANTTLTVKKGARLLCEPAVADSVVFESGASLVIDGGEMIGPATTTAPATSGAIRLGNNSMWSTGGGGSLKVTNGGKLTVDRGNVTANSSMLFVSSDKSSVLFDGGSTVTFGGEKNWTYPICMGNCSLSTFTVREATFNFTYFRLGGAISKKMPCHSSDVLFENAKVSGESVVIFGLANGYGDVSSGNTLTVSGDQSDVSFNYNSSQDYAQAYENVFKVIGGKYTGDVTLGGYQNDFQISGGAHTGGVTLGGQTNTMQISGGSHDGDFTVNGEGDVLQVSGGSYTGKISLSGTGNKVVQTGGAYVYSLTRDAAADSNPLIINGTSNELQVLGGTFDCGKDGTKSMHTTDLRFSSTADGCRAVFSNCTARLSQYGYYRKTLVFDEGAKDCSVVVDQDATLTVCGENNWGANKCTDCSFEFRGTNPRMALSYEYWTTATYQYVFGNADSDYDGKTVALSFVLPEAPYATAPVYGGENLRAVKFHPNAKIVVKEGAWTLGAKKLFYPLVYDQNDFNGDFADGTLLAALNAHATLPEGAVLEYHAADKVLGVKMPKVPSGMCLIFR